MEYLILSILILVFGAIFVLFVKEEFKLKIATISNDLVVLEYFDGDSWRECLFGESAFPIRSSNNLPEQLKYVCTHYACLSSFGYVYF